MPGTDAPIPAYLAPFGPGGRGLLEGAHAVDLRTGIIGALRDAGSPCPLMASLHTGSAISARRPREYLVPAAGLRGRTRFWRAWVAFESPGRCEGEELDIAAESAGQALEAAILACSGSPSAARMLPGATTSASVEERPDLLADLDVIEELALAIGAAAWMSCLARQPSA